MKFSFHLYFALGLFSLLGCSSKLPISDAYNDLAANRKVEKESNEVAEEQEQEIIIAFPPPEVENSFRQVYPSVMIIAWTKRIPLIKLLDNRNVAYKAIFKFQEEERTMLYSESGILIESRMKIAVSELSTDLKLAIERKYPGATLLEAFTFKSIHSKGTFGATISQVNQNGRLEILMMDDGTFVE